MRPRSSAWLERFVERLTALSAPRHRDLARAMLAELESIADRAERRRFAFGAIAAMVRLALAGYTESILHALGRIGIAALTDNINPRGFSMPELSNRQLLRRHVTPFAITFALLTALLLARLAARLLPELSARGVSAGTLLEAVLLGIPSMIALTIPMAVFIAVAWVFTRLGRDGVLAAVRRERHGIRRLVGPVLGAAALLAAVTFVLNTQVLPRANARFTALVAEAPVAQTDRSMTVGELREAARNARAVAGPEAAARAAAYEVEIQKKFALAAACLVLALAGAAIALRFPRGGTRLVIGASGVVFSGYYILVVLGEALADMRVLSPVVAMWMANALLLAVVLLLLWRPRGAGGLPGETLAAGG